MTTKFITSQQAKHLEIALDLTGSLGFMNDARAIAIYRTQGDGAEDALAAVAVLECFRGGRAELHFGNVEGHRLTLETIQGIIAMAFSPRGFNLSRLMARIPVWNTMSLSALIRIGFEVEYRDRASTGQGSDAIVLSLDRETIISKASAEPQTETKPEVSGE